MKITTTMGHVLILMIAMLAITNAEALAQDSIIVSKAGMYSIPGYDDEEPETLYVYKGTKLPVNIKYVSSGSPKVWINDNDDLENNFRGGFIKVKAGKQTFTIDPEMSCFTSISWSNAWYENGEYVKMKREDRDCIDPTEFEWHFEVSFLTVPLKTRFKAVPPTKRNQKKHEETMKPFRWDPDNDED